MVHHGHLPDDRLHACYVSERAGEPIDPPSAEHLADCPACAARFGELRAFMDDIRRQGETDADEHFTPDRLHAQHASIMKRLAHAGRPARVISFPARLREAKPAASPSRTAPRWIAAAAAAGLFIGVALGAGYQWEARAHTPRQVAALHQGAAGSRLTPVATRGIGAAPATADEDAFLSDLEVALARPRTRELQPFDALTPHVRDISTPIR
jgi:hypothetical protein